MSSFEERIAKLEALVERQQATIEQQQCALAERDAVIERLQVRITQLERGPGEPGGKAPPTPPRGKTAEPSGRKRGGQPGHKGHRSSLLPPEKVTRMVDCFPQSCRSCGEALAKEPDEAALRHQVVELPNVAPEVTINRVLELAPTNWRSTLERPEVQRQLESNVFRQVALGKLTPTDAK